MKSSQYKAGEIFIVTRNCHGERWNEAVMQAVVDFDMDEKADEWADGFSLKHMGLLSSVPIRIYNKPLKSKKFMDWLVDSELVKEIAIREVAIPFNDNKLTLSHDDPHPG